LKAGQGGQGGVRYSHSKTSNSQANGGPGKKEEGGRRKSVYRGESWKRELSSGLAGGPW